MQAKYKKRNSKTFFKKGENKKAGIIIKLALILIAVIVFFTILDMRLRPVITTMAQYQCRVISIMAMNEVLMEELAQGSTLSGQIVEVNQNSEGVVTSIEVDTAALNDVKSRLTQAVATRLIDLKKQDITIPLGTLLGWQLLAGRGPDIKLQVVPASFVQATTENTLVTAGINQTQHRISIKFVVDMSALLPGYSTNVTVENEVCVAETLIVGSVPQVYGITNR